MTYIDALAAKLKPYVLSDDSLQVILLENGLDESDDYNGTQAEQIAMKRCLIDALTQCKTLTEESDNGSKQKYDTDQLDERIRGYKDELDEPADRPQHVDLTQYW